MIFEDKLEQINDLQLDIKAEFIVSCMLSEGIDPNNISLAFDGILKRKWAKDIDYSEIETFENNKKALSIHLNRAGIYDTLPEALFHATNDSKHLSGEEMAKDSLRLKTEEKQARKFFRPFENEIFLQGVRLANSETNLNNSILTDSLNGLIPGFWKIDEKIPNKYQTKLIKLLPYASTFIGNFELIAEALSFIIDEEVKITVDYEDKKNTSIDKNQHTTSLGEGLLGSDFIVGSSLTGFSALMSIQIGPLQNTQATDFYDNKPADLLLKTFINYFTPAEYDVETKLILNDTEKHFKISSNKDETNATLGINTII